MLSQDKISTVQQILQTQTLPRPWVFTNGVFDLLHRGHVSYLEQARALGASLIVGVNSDNSVKLLNKGKDRPIVSENDRAFVLAGLQSVSAVVLFSENKPLALIEALKPDIYVKGGDYDINKLEETALMQRWRGKALALTFVNGYATSKLLERIMRQA